MIATFFRATYTIHEDNFTETMDGITSLLRIIKSDINLPHAPICRAIILMSHFMIENVFWNTVKKYINEKKVDKSTKEEIESGFNNNIGIRKAMDEWPQLIVKNKFDFSKEPFASLRCLIDERNEITHSNRISYYSSYIDTYEGASSAYYTAIESAKAIQQHFNGSDGYSYAGFETVFLPPENILFQKALSLAKKKSICLLEKHEFPRDLKSLESYKSSSRQKFEDIGAIIFGENYIDLFGSSIKVCEYIIQVSEYFIVAINELNEDEKQIIAKKLSPLFCTLTKKKMKHYYGVTFGEVLPHIKLKIKRISFENHHGYMCMPAGSFLIVFIIETNSIELTDIIKV